MRNMKSDLMGIVFNIQKFCLHDGPGIRTTVFLQGCPLACSWCSNAESQDFKSQQTRKDDFADEIIQEARTRTVQEVIDVCLQDIDFYSESDGGVTLSGGEPLAQPEFAKSLLKALKENEIHTAVETTGFIKSEIFIEISQWIDLFLFDVKHWNGTKHKKGTGVSNKPILKNLQSLIDMNKNVLPRIPVIPEYNNSLADAEEFAHVFKKLGIKKIQLLPFHQFGEKKYEALNKHYDYKDFPSLNEEDLLDYKQVFINNDIDAFF